MIRSEAGFTLAEMLVATALMLIVSGAVFAIVAPAQDASMAQPEAMDMQQRLRVGSDALFQDLVAAGGGLDAGPSAGSLSAFLPPIVPRKMGLQNGDAAAVVRSDAVTILSVPNTHAQTALSAALAPSSSPSMTVSAAAGCALGQPLCGFVQGMTVLVFDGAGHFDTFALTQVQLPAARLQHHASDASYGYASGAAVSEVATHTYYFDEVNAQLRHSDGYQTDAPVIDNVVGLTFSYYGDPQSPTLPKPPLGVANCLYDAAGHLQPLPTLSTDGSSLAPLPLSILNDGPWCGSGTSQFDADLLRIRKVRVTLRVQVGPAALRGVSAVDFARPGTSRGVRYVPDYTMMFDVSPRNLNPGHGT